MRMEASSAPKSIVEGQAEIKLTTEKVFYNPVQEFNRDLSVAVLTVFTDDYKKEKHEKAEKKNRNNGEDKEKKVEEVGTKIYIQTLFSTSLNQMKISRLKNYIQN